MNKQSKIKCLIAGVNYINNKNYPNDRVNAEKDAIILRDFLKNKKIPHISLIAPKTVPTLENMLLKMSDILYSLDEDETIVLFLAGHGCVDNFKGNKMYGFCCYDTILYENIIYSFLEYALEMKWSNQNTWEKITKKRTVVFANNSCFSAFPFEKKYIDGTKQDFDFDSSVYFPSNLKNKETKLENKSMKFEEMCCWIKPNSKFEDIQDDIIVMTACRSSETSIQVCNLIIIF
jgi:hypothetical protein